jgi:hypothetical protein
VAKQAKERIKRGSRVRIQKSFSQPRLAHLAYGQVLAFVPRITETGFPVPSPKIVTEFSHLTLEANVKQSIPVGELLASYAGIVNSAKLNPRTYGEPASVREIIWDSRIRNRERIKCVHDWHTDARWTKAHVEAWHLEWIGHKRHSCQR